MICFTTLKYIYFFILKIYKCCAFVKPKGRKLLNSGHAIKLFIVCDVNMFTCLGQGGCPSVCYAPVKKWQIQLLSGQLSSVLPYLTTVWHIVSRETCVNLRACVRAYEFPDMWRSRRPGRPGVSERFHYGRVCSREFNELAPSDIQTKSVLSVRGYSHTYLLGRLNWNFPVACCLQVWKQSSTYLVLAFDIRNIYLISFSSSKNIV